MSEKPNHSAAMDRLVRVVVATMLSLFLGGMFAIGGIDDGKWWIGLASAPVWWLLFYMVMSDA